MKSKFSSIIFAILCGMFIASCGSGGGSGKKIAKNDVLGDLPNVLYQKHFGDSVIDAKEREALKNLKWTESDMKKGMKIKEKFKAEREKVDVKYDAEIKKVEEQLLGKDIPFEVEEGLGYKVNSFKITSILKYGVIAEFEVETTDVKVANIERYSNKLVVQSQNIDKNGNVLGETPHYIKLNGKEDGVKATETMLILAEKNYADFAKVKFVNSK